MNVKQASAKMLLIIDEDTINNILHWLGWARKFMTRMGQVEAVEELSLLLYVLKKKREEAKEKGEES